MKIFITQFENFAAAAKREGRIDLERLLDLIRSTSAPAKSVLPWLKLARFGPLRSPGGSLRHDANVLGVHGIEVDYDLESMSVDTAIEIAEKAGLHCLIYTSPSHTPERPRWRILCPTSRELPPGERAKLVSRINGLYRGIFATESWTLSQSYYFGAVGNNPDHQAELIDGECIDLLDELDKIAIGKPNGSAGEHGAASSYGGPLDEDGLANEIVTGKGFHVASVRLIGKWAQQGIPLLEAQRRIEALFDKVFPRDRDQRWRDRRADVARCVLDIYAKEAKKDDAVPAGDTAGAKNSNGAPPGAAAAATQAADWPEPADLLSPAPVPRFPADFLPGAFGKLAEQQAFDLQAPLDFVAIPLLIAAATAIGKEFRMAPKGHANWTERGCLWGACVGHVGEGKTPAFNAAFAPIWPLQKKWREEFEDELKAHKRAVKRARAVSKQWEKAAAAALKSGDDLPDMPAEAEPPETPYSREMITNDATQERIAQLLMNNPRGMLFYRDELSGWFSSFNQYRPGADEQFYLICHAGGPWRQHRVRGDVVLPDVFLGVFGGLQPDVVAAALARGSYSGKPDNGLTARFSLLAWPEAIGDLQWVDNSPDHDLGERVNRLFERLSDLNPEGFVGPRPEGWSHYPPLRFTPDAQDVFRDWYLAHHQGQQAIEPDAQIRGHFAKYDGLFARLALVHHLLRYVQNEPGVGPASIDTITATAVRRFIDGYLRPHACKVYGHLGRDPGYAGAKKIGQWLINNPGIDRFTARDISQKEWAGLTGRNENTGKNYLQAALDHLDNVAGWVRAEDVPTGPRGGRPTVVYAVNPKISR